MSPIEKSRRASTGAKRAGARSDATNPHRLLMRLGEAGIHAHREQDQIVLVHEVRGATGERFALSDLAPLIERGSVHCVGKGSGARFILSDAGRMALARLLADGGDGFAAQHRDMGFEGAATPIRRRINRREDPLEALRRYRDRQGKPLCEPSAFDAAERFRNDLVVAESLPRMTTDWSRLAVDGARRHDRLDASEVTVAARLRLDTAFRALGSDFANLLIDLCGFSKGLEQIEIERGWPVRSAKVIAGFALKALARHYGLEETARGPDHAATQRWAAPDARPTRMGAA